MRDYKTPYTSLKYSEWLDSQLIGASKENIHLWFTSALLMKKVLFENLLLIGKSHDDEVKRIANNFIQKTTRILASCLENYLQSKSLSTEEAYELKVIEDKINENRFGLSELRTQVNILTKPEYKVSIAITYPRYWTEYSRLKHLLEIMMHFLRFADSYASRLGMLRRGLLRQTSATDTVKSIFMSEQKNLMQASHKSIKQLYNEGGGRLGELIRRRLPFIREFLESIDFPIAYEVTANDYFTKNAELYARLVVPKRLLGHINKDCQLVDAPAYLQVSHNQTIAFLSILKTVVMDRRFINELNIGHIIFVLFLYSLKNKLLSRQEDLTSLNPSNVNEVEAVYQSTCSEARSALALHKRFSFSIFNRNDAAIVTNQQLQLCGIIASADNIDIKLNALGDYCLKYGIEKTTPHTLQR